MFNNNRWNLNKYDAKEDEEDLYINLSLCFYEIKKKLSGLLILVRIICYKNPHTKN